MRVYAGLHHAARRKQGPVLAGQVREQQSAQVALQLAVIAVGLLQSDRAELFQLTSTGSVACLTPQDWPCT